MTCIIGVIGHDGNITLGADGRSVSGLDIWPCEPKVFIKNGIGFGFSGDGRIHQIVKYKMEFDEYRPAEYGLDPMKYIVTHFLDKFRTTLRDCGFLEIKDNLEKMEIGYFIMAFSGRLFTVWKNLQVDMASEGFLAIGSGSDLARGVAYAKYGLSEPFAIVNDALECAAKYNSGCGKPFTIIEIKK